MGRYLGNGTPEFGAQGRDRTGEAGQSGRCHNLGGFFGVECMGPGRGGYMGEIGTPKIEYLS